MPPENTRKTSGLIKLEQMAKDGLRVLKPSLLQCVKSVQIQSFFSGQYFPVFGMNTGKYGPEKTLYLDTFHACY